MLLLSGIAVSAIGLAAVPRGLAAVLGEGRRAHLVLPASDPDIPWTALLVLMLSTNVWSAPTRTSTSRRSARRAPGPPRWGSSWPGSSGSSFPSPTSSPASWPTPSTPSIRPDEAYFFVIERLVPAGLRGLVFAVLCAAVVSAVQAGINGVATIFTFDVYGRIGRKGADEARLIRVGRVFAGTALAVGALWAPMVARFGRIFSYFQEGWAFVAVPVAVTFVAGVLWKRMNANAALVTLSLVFPMLVFAYLLRLGGVGMNAFNVAGLVLAGTILLVLVLGFVTKPTGTEDLSMVWGQARPGTHDAAEAPVHRGVAFWAAVMILAYAAVYAALW